MPLKTPVALIIFNRPDLTRAVFETIRRAQPKELLIIADGPRTPEDQPKCAQARAAAQEVDWDCKLRLRFSDTNLGCGRGPATGIDWVFAHVEQAIILEDDCLPAPSFFPFCESLLNHYRDDERVMHISGDSFQLGHTRTPYSYFFSKYTHGCGWATWRRAWQHYDFEIKRWGKFVAQGMLGSLFPDEIERAFWLKKLQPLHEKTRDDAWDYQWNCCLWMHGGLAIFPSVNLVSNLGFREDGTHTTKISRWADLPRGEIDQIIHPPSVVANRAADEFTFNEWYGGHRLRERSTWRYRFSKPVRLYRKFKQRWGHSTSTSGNSDRP